MNLDPRKIVLNTLLSLPSPLLRAMSGGRVVWRGGRTLDPRLQYLAANARRVPALAAIPTEETRAQARSDLALTALILPAGVTVEPLEISGPGGPLPMRVYRPPVADDGAAALVFAHRGGAGGSLDAADGFCGQLAAATRGAVLSIDYRQGPEHRFPAGLEDFLAAYRWTAEHAHRFGATAVAVGGESVGGGFAAAACQALKAAGEPQPAWQLLAYPLLDAAGEGPAMTAYADAWPLSKAEVEAFFAQYLGPEADPADPRASPLRATDVSGLAPALIIRAGFDPTGDQPLAYARRLREAGVPVTFRAYDALVHGFVAYAGAVPAAEAALKQIAALAGASLATRSESDSR